VREPQPADRRQFQEIHLLARKVPPGTGARHECVPGTGGMLQSRRAGQSPGIWALGAISLNRAPHGSAAVASRP
jgi:hypothetical protein